MADFVGTSRPVTLRARRDTIALVALALGLTGALAAAIHARQPSQKAPTVWTGELSDVPSELVPAGKPAITSASLVVPTADLALPKALPKAPPPAHSRQKTCESGTCQAKATGVAPTPRRVADLEPATPPTPVTAGVPAVEMAPRPPADVGPARPGLMSRLNPLGHLPDMAIVRRPLTAANETISGLFKRF